MLTLSLKYWIGKENDEYRYKDLGEENKEILVSREEEVRWRT